MRILQVVGSVDPSMGGPIEAVLRNSKWSAAAGNEIELLTMDDPGDPACAKFPLPVHAVGPVLTSYGYTPRLVPWLRRNAGRYDIAVVNGIWQFPSYAVWKVLHKLAVPYVVSPHGMLDPYFRRAFPWKHRKKAIYWRLFERRVLEDAAAVIFTCERERLLARESFTPYRVREAVVRFGTSAPDVDLETARGVFLAAYPALAGKRLALFLGRIHPKKGCDLLLRAFAATLEADPDWTLVIAGPDQAGWQAELVQLARSLGIEDRTVWPGMLVDAMKWGAFAAAEVFVLPSHQENFGIAVAEALACGVPVLISKEVNIWPEIEACGAALCEADTLEGTQAMFEQWKRMSADRKAAMRTAARPCFYANFESRDAAASLDAILAECIANRRSAPGM